MALKTSWHTRRSSGGRRLILKSYIYNTATFVLLDTDAKYCNPEGADKRHGTLVLFNTIVYTIHPIEKPTLYTISQIQKVLLIHEGQKVRRINTSNFNNIANLIINAIENSNTWAKSIDFLP